MRSMAHVRSESRGGPVAPCAPEGGEWAMSPPELLRAPQDHCLCEARAGECVVTELPQIFLHDPAVPAGRWCSSSNC